MVGGELRPVQNDCCVLKVQPGIAWVKLARVDDELTKLGRSLLKPIRELGNWAGQNRERIQSARDKYDAQKPNTVEGFR